VPNEIYIWGNTYQNTGGCIPSDSSCWEEYSEGAPERIALNENYFFRAPKEGERLYSYMTDDSTPNQYIYPHPMQSGGSFMVIKPPESLRVLSGDSDSAE
jgi:hypothetical protein